MTNEWIVGKLGALCCVGLLALGCDSSDGAKGAKDDTKAKAGAAEDTKKDDAPPAPTLPAAEELLAKAVEAAGGEAAFAKFKSFYYRGQLEVAGQKLEAKTELWWKEGDFFTLQDMLGVGQVKAGKDGETIWSEDPINGQRVLDGLEAEQVAWMSSLMLAADWKRYFDKAETIKEMQEGDSKVYVVKLTSSSGAELAMHLDAESGLQTGMALTQASPMGNVPIVLKMEDYRDFEGVKLAFKQVTSMPIATATLEIVELKLNPEISAARFQMPKAGADVVKKPAPADAGPK